MSWQGHYYSFLGAIDLAWKAFAPGNIQIEATQKWAWENGVRCFDFLSDPSPYKEYWTNMTVPVETRYVPLSWKGATYCNLWRARVRPTFKSIYNSAGPNLRKNISKFIPKNGKKAA